MTFLVLLRAVSDAGIYFFFAGVIAGLFGADTSSLALGLAVECLALTAGYCLRGRGLRFLTLAAPAAYIAFAASGAAERIALAPMVLYAATILATEEYEPAWDHEAELFSRFWKISGLILGLWVLFGGITGGGSRLLEGVALPAALVTMTALVLLTRALRHDRDVYRRGRRQLTDIAIFSLLLLAAAFLSSGPVLGGLAQAARLAFYYLILPILRVVLRAAELVLGAVFFLLSIVIRDGAVELPSLTQDQGMAGGEPVIPEAAKDAGGSALVSLLLVAAGAAVIAYLAYRLLRLLTARGPALEDNGEQAIERTTLAEPETPRTKGRDRTPAGRIRREYRRFLRLCRERDIPLRPRDTTLTVSAKAASRAAPDEPSRALRSIYISARYGGFASPDSAARAEELVKTIRREW